MKALSYKTIFRVDYKAHLAFFEKLLPLAQAIEGYPNWRTNRISVTLRNTDEHYSLYLGHDNFWYCRDLKNGIQGDDKRIRDAIRIISVNTLEKNPASRVGLRRLYLCPVEMSFDNLVVLMNQKLFQQNEALKKGIAPNPTDLAYSVHFKEENIEVHLRLGPVRKEELPQQLQPDIENNFKGLRSIEEIFSECPPVSALFDIDAIALQVDKEALNDVYERSVALHEKLSHNLVSYLFGLGAK